MDPAVSWKPPPRSSFTRAVSVRLRARPERCASMLVGTCYTASQKAAAAAAAVVVVVEEEEEERQQ